MFGLLLVTKNESDLLRSNLRHHLSWGIDRIAVADNESTDATSAVAAAAGDRVAYRTFPSFHDRQTVRHEMLRDMIASSDGQLEWVGIADTDEFFWVPGEPASLFADVPVDVDAVNFGAELFLPTALDPPEGPVFVRRAYYSADESSPLHTSYREGKTFYRASWLASLPVDHNCARHEHECLELASERVHRVPPGVVHHYMIQDEDQFVEKVTRLIEWAKPPTGAVAALRWRMQPPRKRDLPQWTSTFKKDWWSAYQRGGEAEVRRYYREQYVIPEAQVAEHLERGWLARDGAFAAYAAATLTP